ncbi:MAG: DUF1365 domain-containing protein [Proteobacteria bacterium]|nr:DUF1365 domain-containing protein [Pseudomonadota bacterium]
MEIIPQIFTAKVMHKRLFPQVNGFTYGVYYLALPLSKLYSAETFNALAVNKFGVLSFYEKDHSGHDGNCENRENRGMSEQWIRNILCENSLNEISNEIILISMPRVLGYVFNPISIWLCLDKESNLRAVLCEVNNTFGETHSYLCAHEAGRIINNEDWITAKKLFHVSPFLKREGSYKFRFSIKKDKLDIGIDFYNEAGKKQLITSLIGELTPLTPSSLRKAFLKHPLVTVKTILLIHWQALKLVAKGVRYIAKPKQIAQKLSQSDNEDVIDKQ